MNLERPVSGRVSDSDRAPMPSGAGARPRPRTGPTVFFRLSERLNPRRCSWKVRLVRSDEARFVRLTEDLTRPMRSPSFHPTGLSALNFETHESVLDGTLADAQAAQPLERAGATMLEPVCSASRADFSQSLLSIPNIQRSSSFSTIRTVCDGVIAARLNLPSLLVPSRPRHQRRVSARPPASARPETGCPCPCLRPAPETSPATSTSLTGIA